MRKRKRLRRKVRLYIFRGGAAAGGLFLSLSFVDAFGQSRGETDVGGGGEREQTRLVGRRDFEPLNEGLYSVGADRAAAGEVF